MNSKKISEIRFSTPVMNPAMHLPPDWQGTAADFLRFALETTEYPQRPAAWPMYSHKVACGEVDFALWQILDPEHEWLSGDELYRFGLDAIVAAFARLDAATDGLDAAVESAFAATYSLSPLPSAVMAAARAAVTEEQRAVMRRMAQDLYNDVYALRRNHRDIPAAVENFAAALVSLGICWPADAVDICGWGTTAAAQRLLRQIEEEAAV